MTFNLIESLLGRRVVPPKKLLSNQMISRFYLGNLYFPSELSSNYISMKNGRMEIKGVKSDNLRIAFSRAKKLVTKHLKQVDIRVIPNTFRLLRPGEDIHYGGTLPMTRKPTKAQCNPSGELHGQENFFITDASSLPSLAAKPITFNAMAQAHYVSSLFRNAQ